MTSPTPLLDVTDLSLGYRHDGRTEPALLDVSLTITRGRVTAIIGESGSGKSSLAHAILKLLPSTAQISGGHIRFEGEDLARLSDRELRSVRGRRIGFVPQDPIASLNPTKTIGAQIREAYSLARSTLSPDAIQDQILADLAEVGFSDPEGILRRYPHELSGGQRQRVLVSIAFSQRPSLVIADEPTSALDVLVGKDVLASIHRMRQQHGTTMAIITHDLTLAAVNADDVVVLQRGVVVESGPIAEVFARPQHPYTQQLLASSSRIREGQVDSISELYRRRPVSPPIAESEPVIELVGVTRQFTGKGRSTLAVDDLSLAVPAGTTFALVGESGSGKTTTSRMILGLERPDSGEVRVFGQTLSTLDRRGLRCLRREMQPVYQSPYESLNPGMSIGSIIAEPLDAFGIGARADRSRRVNELLDLVQLPQSYRTRRPGEVSGGQRQRVAIARALALQPRLLVLDEPVSALDATIQSQVLALLRDVQAEFGLTYFLVTHDLSVVVDLADHVAVMRGGRVLEFGTTSDVVLEPSARYTRELLQA